MDKGTGKNVEGESNPKKMQTKKSDTKKRSGFVATIENNERGLK